MSLLLSKNIVEFCFSNSVVDFDKKIQIELYLRSEQETTTLNPVQMAVWNKSIFSKEQTKLIYLNI